MRRKSFYSVQCRLTKGARACYNYFMNEGEEQKGKKSAKPLHSGHRQRMMERFETGAEFFQDHELLEVLLYNAIPRSNTNPIAHALISSFGSLAGVFSASVRELMLVRGVGKRTAEYIKCIGLCFERVKPAPTSLPLYFSPKDFREYLEGAYRDKQKEELEIFCLDKLGRIFFRKSFSSGESNEVTAEPTEISELLLVKKPHTVVVAHNHPFGDARPSSQDDVFTRQLLLMCRLHNVRLGDHIILGRSDTYSYRAAGKLDQMRNSVKQLEGDRGSDL